MKLYQRFDNEYRLNDQKRQSNINFQLNIFLIGRTSLYIHVPQSPYCEASPTDKEFAHSFHPTIYPALMCSKIPITIFGLNKEVR